MARKKTIPSNNFCVLCGRHTNEKKRFGENWDNFFFACNYCQKVWCVNCFGQLIGKGPRKSFKLGKKGQINCLDCNNFIPMIRLPENLPFVQKRGQAQKAGEKKQELGGMKTCTMCGQKLKQGSNFCDYCGEKQ